MTRIMRKNSILRIIMMLMVTAIVALNALVVQAADIPAKPPPASM